jgi:Cysteine-rich CPXCG
MTDLLAVTCPSCFEEFEVAAPPPDEVPCTVDYDCEVCCRPMVIHFSEYDGDIAAEAVGLGS